MEMGTEKHYLPVYDGDLPIERVSIELADGTTHVYEDKLDGEGMVAFGSHKIMEN